MLFKWDLDVGAIVQSAGTLQLKSVTVLRTDAFPAELQFWRNGAIYLPEDGAILLGAVVKKKNVFDGASLIPEVVFARDADRQLYTAAMNFITDELDAELAVDGDTANDVADIGLQLGFGFSLDGGAHWTPSNNIALEVDNNVFRGNETTPAALDTPFDWLAQHGSLFLSAVTDYTGGGSTKLDGFQTTDGLSVPRFYRFYKSGLGMQDYMLKAGTAVEVSPGVILPDDYDSVTNQRFYEKQG